MTLENWNSLMYLVFLIPDNYQFFYILYIISWIFIGNYVLLNLFLAILLEGFSLGGTKLNEDFIDQLEVEAEVDF